MQIYIAPILALVSIGTSVSEIGKVADHYPGLVFVAVLEAIGRLAIVTFDVYTGLRLRRLQPGVVLTVNRYLLGSLVWSILTLALPSMGGDLPARVVDAMRVEYDQGVVRALVVFHDYRAAGASARRGDV